MLRVDPDLDLRFHLQRVELQWDPLPWGKLMLGFERARMLPLILPPMPLYRPAGFVSRFAIEGSESTTEYEETCW